jgi:hypothetical protein
MRPEVMSACAFGIGGRKKTLATVETTTPSMRSAERKETGFAMEKGIGGKRGYY